MSREEDAPKTFRVLVENAERKFARVRDAPLHPYCGSGPQYGHFFHKVFKAYMRLWKYQQENRAKLTESGLQRWEIGEIASRIGQLYFYQYLRTSETRFLLEAYIFYEAIFNRRYFDGSTKDRGVRFKELRFYARFLMVSLIMNHVEMVKLLVQRFKDLVDDSRVNFRGTNFKEWRLVVQEIMRFTEADSGSTSSRPLRYTVMFDSYPASLPYVARFHAKRLLKFRDALLTSYHKNEVKFAELTLDTFRMLQSLEWEPSGSFYQKHPVEPRENGGPADHSVTSGLIDVNLMADMTDPNLPPNPKKAVLYRPSVTQLIAVIAAICEELPTDSVMLLYLSAAGNSGHSSTSQVENNEITRKSSLPSASANNHREQRNGSNILFPGDLIPFTRRPLFLIIDSNNSHAFKAGSRPACLCLAQRQFPVVVFFIPSPVILKIGLEVPIFLLGADMQNGNQVLRGAERGEPVALFLSPLRPSFKNSSVIDSARHGSQFTFFLTTPLLAFGQLVDFNLTEDDKNMSNSTESILSSAFSKWEQILCTSTDLDLVWAQLLSDPFLRRLILRFIFCRAVLTLFCKREEGGQYLPICIPELPSSVSANSKAVQPAITQLANNLKVTDCFRSL
ncbi:hypothetical protein SASPL_146965 [Salvia splendens]|uniref:RGS domain-containing protein n=1 Tax=Salvia splendens TaxID=180675 RepID=A0A8X8WDM0_SALSN|nr:hypothetical protein SASPL_146965 [Salvia splendens]